MSVYDTLVEKLQPPIINGKRVPYVILGWRVKDWSAGAGNPKEVPNVVAFPLIGCHGLPGVIHRHVLHGRKVLGYWFPKNAKSDIEELLPDGTTTKIITYSELEAVCRNYMGINTEIEQVKTVMEKKIADQQAEIEKLRGRK